MSTETVLKAHISKQEALLKEREALDKEQLTLMRIAEPSEEQKKRKADINDRLNQIAVEMQTLAQTTQSETDDPTKDPVKAIAKQELFKTIQSTLPPPDKGKFNVVHGNITPGDMISYMKFTQYLNPYGRKRQCDTDLENLMAVINKSVNNSMGEYKELAKKVVKTAKT